MVLTVKIESERKSFTAKVKIDLASFEFLYVGKELKIFKEFKIKNINATFIIWDRDYTQKSATKNIYFQFKDEAPHSMQCQYKSMYVGLENWSVKSEEGKFSKFDKHDDQLYFTWGDLFGKFHGEKLRRFYATFTITIEAGTGYLLKELFIREFSVLTPNSELSEDFELKSNDKKVTFDKELLCQVSDVFKRMIENPMTSESQEGCINLNGISIQTIESFKKILTKNTIDCKDLNVEMLVFADRYNIQPLVKFCQNHLKNSVTKENFMDIVKAADVINDKDLMQAAAKFASLNIGKFDKDPEIKNFIKTNPECFANIWELMMFK